MKRLFGIIFLLLFPIFFAYQKQKENSLKNSGYISCFQANKGYYKDQFKKKIQLEPSIWAQKQIENDFIGTKISLQALQATHKAALASDKTINRYRIVDNRLYRFFDRESATKQAEFTHVQKEPIVWFEKGLQTLLQLSSIPNLDFIVTHEDGTFTPFLADRDEWQSPVLGWAKLKSTPFLVLIPDWRSLSFWWYNDIKKLTKKCTWKIPWEQKRELAFWRGAFTERTYREKIAALSYNHPDLINAGICSGIDPNHIHYKPSATYEEHLTCKYLPVLDGVMCTYPGYQWRLLSGGLCLKQESDQIQWFYGALKSYEHYVPIRQDLSDLADLITWAKEHDSECQKIVSNGMNFCRENLMLDDVYVYLYHVLIHYSKQQDTTLDKEWDLTRASPDWLEVANLPVSR